jgi:hypothetical protein
MLYIMGSVMKILQEIRYGDVEWIYLAHDRVQWQADMSTVTSLWILQTRGKSLPAERFLLFKKDSFPWSLLSSESVRPSVAIKCMVFILFHSTYLFNDAARN